MGGGKDGEEKRKERIMQLTLLSINLANSTYPPRPFLESNFHVSQILCLQQSNISQTEEKITPFIQRTDHSSSYVGSFPPWPPTPILLFKIHQAAQKTTNLLPVECILKKKEERLKPESTTPGNPHMCNATQDCAVCHVKKTSVFVSQCHW